MNAIIKFYIPREYIWRWRLSQKLDWYSFHDDIVSLQFYYDNI